MLCLLGDRETSAGQHGGAALGRVWNWLFVSPNSENEEILLLCTFSQLQKPQRLSQPSLSVAGSAGLYQRSNSNRNNNDVSSLHVPGWVWRDVDSETHSTLTVTCKRAPCHPQHTDKRSQCPAWFFLQGLSYILKVTGYSMEISFSSTILFPPRCLQWSKG